MKTTVIKHRLALQISALLTAFTLLTAACSATPAAVTTAAGTSAQTTPQGVSTSAGVAGETASVVDAAVPVTVEYSAKDLQASYDEAAATKATFTATKITVDGTGAFAGGSILRVTAAGTYLISGTSPDGQILVEAPEDADVILVLDGLDLTNLSSSALLVIQADKVVVTLAAGSANTLTDGADYVGDAADADAPNAAIYSKADLTINGLGALTINGNYNNGIVSKDDLKIVSGQITVTAVNDGIKGKDLMSVKDGDLTITAGGDGIQSDNEEDASKGVVSIEGGTITITSDQDAIQAETALVILGGELDLTSGGGGANSSQTSGWGTWGAQPHAAGTEDSSDSAKGLKAGTELTIAGGIIRIDSSDDSIHSNGNITINGGAIEIASGDDALHADSALVINDGDIYITTSFEGLEGATVTINDGKIHVGSLDDGVNTSGGNDGSSVSGRPGQNNFNSSDGSLLTITGGYLFIDAEGDGMDANGNISMTGGTVIVNGPTNNGNGAVDYNGEFTLTGGTVLALGSSGMAQNISATSTQAAFLVNTEPIAAGTVVSVAAADGSELVTFTSAKVFSSILFTRSDLTSGETYSISTGGTSSGSSVDGVIETGSYSGGTSLTEVQMTSPQTTLGGTMQGPGGGMPGKRP